MTARVEHVARRAGGKQDGPALESMPAGVLFGALVVAISLLGGGAGATEPAQDNKPAAVDGGVAASGLAYNDTACEPCHAGLTSRKYKHGIFKNGSCADCHLPAERPSACKGVVATGWKLKNQEPELCAACHDKSGDTPMHKVIDLRGCTACHDPHGGDHKRNLKLPVTELCQQCHRRPDDGAIVHAAVKEGKCIGCHEPHSGVVAPLLREERQDLCAECHEAGDLSDRHKLAKGTCLDCHAPHASDLPGLVRTAPGTAVKAKPEAASYDAAPCEECHAGLTARQFRHSLFKNGTCADCHVPSDTPGKCTKPLQAGWRLKKRDPELCAGCHDKSGDTPMHKPIEMRGCTACHDPHGAEVKKLLKAPSGELCLRCHERKDSRQHTHTAVKEGKCIGCHEPHSGVAPPLLREARQDLCAECHEQDALLPDPEKHGPVAANRCLECHDPHGSDQPKALLATGRDLCLRCHAQGAKAPGREDPATAKQLDMSLESTHNPVRNDDCQTCHVQTHSGKVKQLLTQPPLELCARCHDKSGNTPMHKAVDSGGCSSCHQPHSSENRKLLKLWPAEKLCYSCHDRQDAQANNHTPVTKGECLGCHNPHSGEESPLLLVPRNELCAECHDAQNLVQGPHVHTPVTEGRCLDCHAPHGSANKFNLRAAAGTPLCLTCHDASKPNPTVLPGKRLTLERQHVHAALDKEGCQACHEMGHVAGNKMLLSKPPPHLCYGCHDRQDARAYTHGAVLLGDCPVCHSPHASNNALLLREASESKSCFQCHQDDLTGRAFIHKPVAEGKCSACHDPHGATAPFNLKADTDKAICAKCHEPSEPVTVKHKALERYGCVACHDPHGTANRFQLIKPVNELCQSCHPNQSDGLHATTFVAGGHLVSGARDPRRPDRAFTCASCHNPHGANSPKLFYSGQSSMLMCEGCHGDRTGKNKELKDLTQRQEPKDPGKLSQGPGVGPSMLTKTEAPPPQVPSASLSPPPPSPP